MRPILFILITITYLRGYSQNIYQSSVGTITFISNAPLEIIKAGSEDLRGIIDFDKKEFAFSVDMTSFQGFNNPLQREHFNENYMESNQFPNSTFLGKIIEDIQPDEIGIYAVRAKGKLTIHGVEKERIINSELHISENHITVYSNFTVLLNDHNIRIPKIVHQKIAEEIEVEVKAEFIPQS